jgi:hypothetical protein
MRKSYSLVLVGIGAALGFGTPAVADDTKDMVLIPGNASVKWSPGPPSLPKGNSDQRPRR